MSGVMAKGCESRCVDGPFWGVIAKVGTG